MEAELIKMEKLATVGQMVITVNHEINNPLVIISTNAQSLRLLDKNGRWKNVVSARLLLLHLLAPILDEVAGTLFR